jgi:hypothetical protein
MSHGAGHLAEYTLCGLAFDAHEAGDCDEPVEESASGETVSCPECRAVIVHVRSTFARFKVR